MQMSSADSEQQRDFFVRLGANRQAMVRLMQGLSGVKSSVRGLQLKVLLTGAHYPGTINPGIPLDVLP